MECFTDDLIEFLAVIKNEGGQLSISRLLNDALCLNHRLHQPSGQTNDELQYLPPASQPSVATCCPHSPEGSESPGPSPRAAAQVRIGARQAPWSYPRTEFVWSVNEHTDTVNIEYRRDEDATRRTLSESSSSRIWRLYTSAILET